MTSAMGILEINIPVMNPEAAPNLPIHDQHNNEGLAQFLKSTVYIQAETPCDSSESR